ncbi:nitrate- and nitrite sensing domain-containing protein [Dactylosporangium sucinum]|nr:nitrate- and nitrite sensing domain-containing protein [Dactylosporangium sucinum]
MVGLAVLTGMQARSSWAVVEESDRAEALADASVSTMDLLDQLDREEAETAALIDRGGVGDSAKAQWASTDGALGTFRNRGAAAVLAAPGLEPTLDAAMQQLAKLATVRSAASPGLDVAYGPPDGSALEDVRGLYDPLTEVLLRVADAIPAALVDRPLANRTQAIAALATARHALAVERDVLYKAFRQRAYAPGGFANLVKFAAVEQERLETFGRVAGVAARANFDRLVTDPEVKTAVQLRDAALSGAAGALKVDADAWYAAMTRTIGLLHEVEVGLAAELSAKAADARADARRDAVVTITGAVSLAISSVVIAIVIATGMSHRLGRLRRAALGTASRLPIVVDEIAVADNPALAHDAQLNSMTNRLDDQLSLALRDEIAEVGAAFATVHATALHLAADQALLRLDTEALVTALARRSQKLVQRQLAAIDDLERVETDPNTLARYYVIDHLAARMRRNAENLLVLTGTDPGRRFTGAFPLLDVVRAAIAEIADYTRVDIAVLPDVSVAGRAVGDLAHLLAELLENAATYSPPQTQVTISAHRDSAGVVITVYDNGIGMAPQALAAANERLREPTMLTSALAGTLGLLVVARLAARHTVRVELRRGDGGGVAALVDLPNEIIGERVSSVTSSTAAGRPSRVAVQSGPPSQPPRALSPAPVKAAAVVHEPPLIYDELRLAWVATRGGQGTHTAADAFPQAPADWEHMKVVQLMADSPPQVDGAPLPRRRTGAHLLPGHIPTPARTQTRDPIDPDRVRSQLAGLSRGVAAAARTPLPPHRNGRRI